MVTLVTGATGFVGSHLVDAFLRAGHRVRCLVRSPTRLGWLEGKDIELAVGDCTRPETLAPAVVDAEIVVHAAAVTWAARRSDYFRVNASGTYHLLTACGEHARALRRFVFISSQAAAGPAADPDRGVTERDPPRPLSAYGESKLLAERHVASLRDRIPSVILRPSAVYGPRDGNFLPYVRMAKRGFLLEFGRVPRTVSLCQVEDLARTVVNAAQSSAAAGAVYFLADQRPYAWSEVERAVCAALGIDARHLIVPKWCLRTAAALGQVYGSVAKRPVRLNAARAAELLEKNWVCDVGKAMSELGYAPQTALPQGMQQLVRWYQQQHWL